MISLKHSAWKSRGLLGRISSRVLLRCTYEVFMRKTLFRLMKSITKHSNSLKNITNHDKWMNSDKLYTQAILSGRNILLGVSINLMLLFQTDNTQALYFGTEAMFGTYSGGLFIMSDKKTWIDRVNAIPQEEENQTKFFDPKDMHPSGECVSMIQEFEGFRSKAYQDSVGVWTIGFGTTRGVKPGQTITREEAEKRMLEELDRYYSSAVRSRVRVPLTQEMFDALSCFVYNVGEPQFANSTMLGKLNQGDYEGAEEEFERWVFAGGQKLAGLVRRRNAEQALFRGEDWSQFIG